MLFNLLLFVSCTEKKVIWTDLRNSPIEEEIIVSFKNDNNQSIDKFLKVNQTKNLYIPNDFYVYAIENVQDINVQYYQSKSQNVIEFFITDKVLDIKCEVITE